MSYLRQVIFTSTATRRITPQDIGDILLTSVPRNGKRGLTGLLLKYDGYFMQVIEGQSDVIDLLLDELHHDTRHKNICIILDRHLTKRDFADWNMGFKDMSKASLKQQYSAYLYAFMRQRHFNSNVAGLDMITNDLRHLMEPQHAEADDEVYDEDTRRLFKPPGIGDNIEQLGWEAHSFLRKAFT